MLNQKEILSTIEMIDQQHLDIRTITMGISLLSCCDPDPKRACEKIYDKITRYADHNTVVLAETVICFIKSEFHGNCSPFLFSIRLLVRLYYTHAAMPMGENRM